MSDHIVDLYVDPACPWCWLTAVWLYEVEEQRPIAVTTRLFSLAEVNRADDARRASHEAGERALRVLVAARRAGGEPAVRSLYRALGEARHERGEQIGEVAVLREAARSAGLEPALADRALDDPSTLTELLGDHAAILERGAFGVPTLSLDGGPAFFGPIVDTRITGEAAGRLWDVVAPLLSEPRLFELKRARTHHPDVGRHRIHATAAG